VDTPNNGGTTPLIQAADNGHTPIVTLLTQLGANVNHQNDDGWTGLCLASANGREETVRVLLSAGADPNIGKKGDGHNSLMVACINGHDEVVRTLLRTGAEVNAANHEGWTAIFGACENDRIGSNACVRALIEAGAQVANTKEDGSTPLHAAAAHGREAQARTLLAAGAPMNTTRGSDGWTPLMCACDGGHAHLVQLLCDGKADVGIVTSDHKSALIMARGHPEVTQVLQRATAASSAEQRPTPRNSTSRISQVAPGQGEGGGSERHSNTEMQPIPAPLPPPNKTRLSHAPL